MIILLIINLATVGAAVDRGSKSALPFFNAVHADRLVTAVALGVAHLHANTTVFHHCVLVLYISRFFVF